MTVRPGDTFLYSFPTEKKHLHIVVEKITSKNMLICAFVSSIVKGRGFDKSCVLNVGDCDFIKHPSYVVYDKMLFFDAQIFEQMAENGYIRLEEHLSDDVLQRVLSGALNSKMTPNNFRKYLEDNSVQHAVT